MDIYILSRQEFNEDTDTYHFFEGNYSAYLAEQY